MASITPPNTLTGAISTAVGGAKKAETKFSKAAVETVTGFANEQNKMVVQQNPQLAAEVAVSAQEFAPEKPITDMVVAQRAYEANLKVVKTADEMTEELLDIKA